MKNDLKIENVSLETRDGHHTISFDVTIPHDAAFRTGTMFGRTYHKGIAVYVGPFAHDFFSQMNATISNTRREIYNPDTMLMTSYTFQSSDPRVVSHLNGLFREAHVACRTTTTHQVSSEKLRDDEFPRIPRSYVDLIDQLNNSVAARIAPN